MLTQESVQEIVLPSVRWLQPQHEMPCSVLGQQKCAGRILSADGRFTERLVHRVHRKSVYLMTYNHHLTVARYAFDYSLDSVFLFLGDRRFRRFVRIVSN